MSLQENDALNRRDKVQNPSNYGLPRLEGMRKVQQNELYEKSKLKHYAPVLKNKIVSK
jgi:hypothetical protein